MPEPGSIPRTMVSFPFAAGLMTKADPRELNTPSLDIALNVQFDSLGALETRLPYAALGTNILGGGTITNPRRLVANSGELVLFTDVACYSWDANDVAWVLRGTHLAVAPQEQTLFATTDDQTDTDVAQLGNVIVYCWTGNSAGASQASLYVAARDAINGSVLLPPTAISASIGRARVVALQTRVLLFYIDSVLNFQCKAIDPANLATSVASAPTQIEGFATFSSIYDVVQIPGADTAVGANASGAGYRIWKMTAGLSFSSATPARTADSAIAVSCPSDGLHVQVLRSSTTNVQGDYILVSNLSDVTINQAIGTTATSPILNIAAAHRSTQDGGQFRCYVFWDHREDGSPAGNPWQCKSNWVDTGGTIGTQATFLRRLGVASRAFNYNGRIYFIGAFASVTQWQGLAGGGYTFGPQTAVQNGYYLYRDDGFPCAVFAPGVAGGFANGTRLSGVTPVPGSATAFACVLNVRRIVPLNAASNNYTLRAPREIRFTFDSNDARRCARLGRTLYVAAGEMTQYDGVTLNEVGFHTAPCGFVLGDIAGANPAAGAYAYKNTYRWQNAQGEIDRSTSVVAGVTVHGGGAAIAVTFVPPLYITHKTANAVAVEYWRTTIAPTPDAPFYLVSSTNVQSVANPNPYVANDPTLDNLASFTDNETDTTASGNQLNPENGAILSNVCPPAASIVVASADRLFLAGIPGEPDKIRYSMLRASNQVAQWNEALSANVPPTGGQITGLAFLNETLICFRQRAIYSLPNDGLDNTGNGANYGPARIISQDVGGVNADAIALTPQGLVFQSLKGWYLLDRGWNVKYIGAAVAKYDSDTVLAVHTIESRHQVRIVTNNRVLVYDYLVNQWAEWTIATGVHACVWNGVYYYLDSSTGAMQEQTTWTNLTYGLDIETAWIKPAGDMQGRAIVDFMLLLGEFRSNHNMRIRCARDYQQDGAGNWVYYDDVGQTKAVAPATVGTALQLRHGPSKKRCQAIKVRLTTYANDGVSPPSGEACRISGLAFEVGVEPGLFRGLPVTQKV